MKKILRMLPNRIKTRSTWFTILGMLLVLCLAYIMIKNEFFYHTIHYFDLYLDYYVAKYLNGNVKDLIVNNGFLFYMENDVQSIFSAFYLYVASFGQMISKILSYIIPISIFHKINKLLYNELYNKYCLPQITRMGKKKYLAKTLIVEMLHSSFIIILPKLLYLIVLCIFFPTNVSYTHVITDASFITQPYLYNAYVYRALSLILIDFLVTFIYAMIVTLIAIFITCLVQNRALSYLIYITTFLILSLVMYLIGYVPLLFYTSVYSYFEFGLSKKLSELIIYGALQLFIWLIIGSFTLKKKVNQVV